MRAMTDTLVWITGASAGIGAALATAVPFDGAAVVDISRSGGTPGTEHLAADLAEPADWPLVAAHLQERLRGFAGRRAVFVHNAGTLEPVGFAGEVDVEAYRRSAILNAAAPQVLGNAFLTAVRECGFAGTAELVLLSSGAARTPYPGWSSYCAGKAAADHWVRSVGAEQRGRNAPVRVLAVAPGVVATAMQERIRAADPSAFPDVDRFRGLHDEGQLAEPADVARRLWSLLDTDVETGSVVDLRSVS